jgi:hypothetical protein
VSLCSPPIVHVVVGILTIVLLVSLIVRPIRVKVSVIALGAWIKSVHITVVVFMGLSVQFVKVYHTNYSFVFVKFLPKIKAPHIWSALILSKKKEMGENPPFFILVLV